MHRIAAEVVETVIWWRGVWGLLYAGESGDAVTTVTFVVGFFGMGIAVKRGSYRDWFSIGEWAMMGMLTLYIGAFLGVGTRAYADLDGPMVWLGRDVHFWVGIAVGVLYLAYGCWRKYHEWRVRNADALPA